MFRKSGRIIVIIMFLFVSFCTEPIKAAELIVECDCPIGSRLEYSDGRATMGSDRFAEGVKLTFVINDKEALKSTVTFSSGIFKNGGKSLGQTSQAEVVHLSDRQVTLLVRYPEAIWVYSLFKNFEVGIFTVHKEGTLGESASSSTFYSKCRFNVPVK